MNRRLLTHDEDHRPTEQLPPTRRPYQWIPDPPTWLPLPSEKAIKIGTAALCLLVGATATALTLAAADGGGRPRIPAYTPPASTSAAAVPTPHRTAAPTATAPQRLTGPVPQPPPVLTQPAPTPTVTTVTTVSVVSTQSTPPTIPTCPNEAPPTNPPIGGGQCP
jgi:hypothetical protein